MDPKINLDEYTTTQPAIGRDSRGNELLYYVSDRVGGEGKFDIWCAKINADGSFENPINLGKKINTEEDEITPFYDAENDSFYFSSNYHYGFGGYDVFKTKGSYNNWSEPENLGYTINSPANDLYYSKSAVTNTIYLTSNRKGSKFLKAATCCNDIYYKKGIDSLPKIIKKDSSIITENKTKIDSSSLAILKKDTFISPPQIINTTLKNIQQLLPVTLYFHNDEPECCNMRDTTALTYSKTYEAYWRLKPTYEKETDKKIIDDFFAEKVDEGYRKLIQFSAQLLDLLNAGNAVEVEIQGYCSPLNFNEYNIHLGNRRVASLKNHFTEYRNNIFQSFIDNKKLILKEKSFGEETADQKISDDREDKKRSVYDVAAATERRVQIISVIIK